MTDHKELFQTFENLWLRTEILIHLGTSIGEFAALSGLLRQAIEEDGDLVCEAMSIDMAELDAFEHEEVIDAAVACGKFGFLGQFGYAFEREGRRSWGMYTLQWLYADTIDELFQKAIEWAKLKHTKDKNAVKQREQEVVG